MGAIRSEHVVYANITSDPTQTPVQVNDRGDEILSFMASHTPSYFDKSQKRWVRDEDHKANFHMVLQGRNARLARSMFESGVLNVGAPIIAVGYADDVNEMQVVNGGMVQTQVFHVQSVGRDLLKEEGIRERHGNTTGWQQNNNGGNGNYRQRPGNNYQRNNNKPYKGGNNPYRRNTNGYAKNATGFQQSADSFEQGINNTLDAAEQTPRKPVNATPGPHLKPISQRLPVHPVSDPVDETPVESVGGDQPVWSSTSNA